ncbi:MAG: Asp-tRNA(Asn)/Glu-tRNA(Gln) amidotransferase subunit GatC [Candidatus Omnitrophota bacterium]
MISKKDVRAIAHLSRIHLQEQEVEHLTKTLEDILGYIEKLNKLDVTNVQPTSHVLPLKNVFRADRIKPSLEQGAVMKITSHTHNGSFKVPQVIE